MSDENQHSAGPGPNSALWALKEAWGHGYDAAVQTIRELADEFSDEQTKSALLKMAAILEEVKPQ